jgi:hypothetical protein
LIRIKQAIDGARYLIGALIPGVHSPTPQQRPPSRRPFLAGIGQTEASFSMKSGPGEDADGPRRAAQAGAQAGAQADTQAGT